MSTRRFRLGAPALAPERAAPSGGWGARAVGSVTWVRVLPCPSLYHCLLGFSAPPVK